MSEHPSIEFSINNPPPIESRVGMGQLFSEGVIEEAKSLLERIASSGLAYAYDDKDPVEEARDLGLIMVDSDNRLLHPHLQIDLDSAEAHDYFLGCMSAVRSIECWLTKAMGHTLITTSKSGKGYHAYIRLEHPMPQQDRIFLQGVLGSDPKREMLSWRGRKMGGEALPRTVLFETHEEAERVWQFLAKEPTKVAFTEATDETKTDPV